MPPANVTESEPMQVATSDPTVTASATANMPLVEVWFYIAKTDEIVHMIKDIDHSTLILDNSSTNIVSYDILEYSCIILLQGLWSSQKNLFIKSILTFQPIPSSDEDQPSPESRKSNRSRSSHASSSPQLEVVGGGILLSCGCCIVYIYCLHCLRLMKMNLYCSTVVTVARHRKVSGLNYS